MAYLRRRAHRRAETSLRTLGDLRDHRLAFLF